ncbi:MAG: sedoheptulose 7-phosphate cyclase [Erythrobacter sp.]|jgi:3-dehydroquinate synthase|nr:sedoheptulose 7-phosphate cyclase [Erythrobacter sp.]
MATQIQADKVMAGKTGADANIAPLHNPATAAQRFFAAVDPAIQTISDPREACEAVLGSAAFRKWLGHLTGTEPHALGFADGFAAIDALDAVVPTRILSGAYNLSLETVFQRIAQIAAALVPADGAAWYALADRIHGAPELAAMRLRAFLAEHSGEPEARMDARADIARLASDNPHAVYPTSPYRRSTGRTVASEDHSAVEAVMHQSTFSSIRMVDHVLEPTQPYLRDIYRPLGRCVCLIDTNVDEHHGQRISAYFAHHGIPLTLLPYRAMEADKGLATVERMLGDFKRLGIMRNEPVLIAGGGVLADTGGLACALYGRNTPYVMIGTSIVTGIDAGPSPRTCCDGFGYKNLLGAYHPPVLCLTDRHFFGSLHEGWLRHGVAEIIKMAVVKDASLFADLEDAAPRLIATRFGTVDVLEDDPIDELSNRILCKAMKSYVEAEYDNLYETHQCRPHAFGHTWSPGFEIQAGLLHGHAVAICMGLGAHLSYRAGWINENERTRILDLMHAYGLALWHDVLLDEELMREAHDKIVQKRGGNLVAPVPRGRIGECGYLDGLVAGDVLAAIGEYREVCERYDGNGRGVDPLCEDVGLEDPATVAHSRVAADAA